MSSSTLAVLLSLLFAGSVIGGAALKPHSNKPAALSTTTDPGPIKAAMLASIRTSWEQGTAAGAIIETDDPTYSVFGATPFVSNGTLPAPSLRLALSAAVRQSSDGRLSQQINDALDGAAMDGASAGYSVLLGTYTDNSRGSFWQNAASAQLNFLLNKVPRTSTGAISHRVDSKQYWADGVFMGFPFIAAYGAVTSDITLLQEAYNQCMLYRNALRQPGPFGPLFAHIRNDDGSFADAGLWGTGNGWAALGMLRVQAAIVKSSFASSLTSQSNDLALWVKEILDGTFPALTSGNLIPDYIQGGANFGDAAASAALASVAYREAVLRPDLFGASYTNTADKIRTAVMQGLDNLGVMSPVVNPLDWGQTGILSTEAQAFGLMLLAAYRDFLG